jgi:hypothetical protein
MARFLDAEVEIDTAPHRGTRVRIAPVDRGAAPEPTPPTLRLVRDA